MLFWLVNEHSSIVKFLFPLAFLFVLYFKVTMMKQEDAFNAIMDPNPCIDGRKANVNLAVLGAKPRNIAGGRNHVIGVN